jgi:Bromodomain/Bromodomain extra-terminal - transcription regulation
MCNDLVDCATIRLSFESRILVMFRTDGIIIWTEPFREPVDWQGLGLNDYPKIIRHPMDLGTIRTRLKAKSYYKTIFQVAEDVRTVWTNCMTYNQDGSDFHRLATDLQKRWDEKYTKLLSELSKAPEPASNAAGSGTATAAANSATGTSGKKKDVSKTASAAASSGAASVPSMATLTERRNFAKSLYALSKEDLGKVLWEVDKKHPAALVKNASEDEIELNIDILPPALLSELSKFAAQHAVIIDERDASRAEYNGSANSATRGAAMTANVRGTTPGSLKPNPSAPATGTSSTKKKQSTSAGAPPQQQPTTKKSKS